jgi:hypothetical protein
MSASNSAYVPPAIVTLEAQQIVEMVGPVSAGSGHTPIPDERDRGTLVD